MSKLLPFFLLILKKYSAIWSKTINNYEYLKEIYTEGKPFFAKYNFEKSLAANTKFVWVQSDEYNRYVCS